MITLVTVPKSFEGVFKTIQENSIKSWLKIKPSPEIILLGNEKGVSKTVSKFKIKHHPSIRTNQFGTPLLDSIFSSAKKMARHRLVCFLNSDIILAPTFLSSVKSAKERFPNFLLVGQRWDINLKRKINTSKSDWFSILERYTKTHGKLHPVTGTDYFIFRKGLYKKIPPFAIGRPIYDEWLIWYAERNRVPVIDITKAAMVIHQNHPYKHPLGAKGLWSGEEAKNNYKLAGGYGHCRTIADASFEMDNNYNISPKRRGMGTYFSSGKRFIHLIKDKFLL